MKTHPGLIVALLLALGNSPLSAQNIITRLLDRVNIITTGNYTAGGETEGSAFVGGIYNPVGLRAQFGFNSGAVADDRSNTLFLNNGVAAGNTNVTRLLTGSVASRTAVNSSSFTLNGNAANNPSINQLEPAWTTALQTIGFNSTQSLVQNVEAASSQWRALTGNSSGTVINGNEFRFTPAISPPLIESSRIAIFNVDGATAFGSTIGQLSGSGFARADTILINVSGLSLDITQNFLGDLQNNETKVLFNFYEATSLTLNSNFRGTVYAPFADVVQNGSNVDGGVIARNFSQNAEVHALTFDAFLPFTPIPEPSSAALFLTAATLATLRRRRS